MGTVKEQLNKVKIQEINEFAAQRIRDKRAIGVSDFLRIEEDRVFQIWLVEHPILARLRIFAIIHRYLQRRRERCCRTYIDPDTFDRVTQTTISAVKGKLDESDSP
jgi:hypothetical protein